MATGKISDCSIDNREVPGINALVIPLQCDLCHAEIPATEAFSFEGADYIYHFCGPQCLDAWRNATNAHDK